ncbi:MAG: cytochrome c oxidase subunit 3, partial [Bacteroidetes bacterium]|nr:cytochrome c oxidase subunit 3 [Bacteroidota bacterium]
FLWAGSFTFWRAERGFRIKSSRSGRVWLRLTIGLAIVFLCGQAKEYFSLLHDHHLAMSSGLFGTAFYTLTGFHGLHVLVGILLMSILLVRMNRGPTVVAPAVVRAIGVYWHFVDAVWVVIFAIVYAAPHLLNGFL